MNSNEIVGGGLGLIGFLIIIVVVAWAILTLLLPFFVHGILNQSRRTNELLADLIAMSEQAAEAAETEAQARSYQAELAIGLARDLGTHAHYQTEVTKHQLATRPVTPAAHQPGV